jgi:hypothetical protein
MSAKGSDLCSFPVFWSESEDRPVFVSIFPITMQLRHAIIGYYRGSDNYSRHLYYFSLVYVPGR